MPMVPHEFAVLCLCGKVKRPALCTVFPDRLLGKGDLSTISFAAERFWFGRKARLSDLFSKADPKSS